MRIIIELESVAELTLLQSFVEMAFDNHIDLLDDDPEFLAAANQRGHGRDTAKRLMLACGITWEEKR